MPPEHGVHGPIWADLVGEAQVGPFRCPLGPTLGLLCPADSDITPRQERQIVHPALGLHGFLSGFGYAAIGLTSRGSLVRVQ
jgi:hypothetical protein